MGNQTGDQAAHKVEQTAMASVLNLLSVFELVHNGLENGPLTQE